MESTQIHTPERLEGESFEAYKSRRRMSKRLAQRTTLFWPSNTRGTYLAVGSTSKQKRLPPRRPVEGVAKFKEGAL